LVLPRKALRRETGRRVFFTAGRAATSDARAGLSGRQRGDDTQRESVSVFRFRPCLRGRHSRGRGWGRGPRSLSGHSRGWRGTGAGPPTVRGALGGPNPAPPGLYRRAFFLGSTPSPRGGRAFQNILGNGLFSRFLRSWGPVGSGREGPASWGRWGRLWIPEGCFKRAVVGAPAIAVGAGQGGYQKAASKQHGPSAIRPACCGRAEQGNDRKGETKPKPGQPRGKHGQGTGTLELRINHDSQWVVPTQRAASGAGPPRRGLAEAVHGGAAARASDGGEKGRGRRILIGKTPKEALDRGNGLDHPREPGPFVSGTPMISGSAGGTLTWGGDRLAKGFRGGGEVRQRGAGRGKKERGRGGKGGRGNKIRERTGMHQKERVAKRGGYFVVGTRLQSGLGLQLSAAGPAQGHGGLLWVESSGLRFPGWEKPLGRGTGGQANNLENRLGAVCGLGRGRGRTVQRRRRGPRTLGPPPGDILATPRHPPSARGRVGQRVARMKRPRANGTEIAAP